MISLLCFGVGADLSGSEQYKVKGPTSITIPVMKSMNWLRDNLGGQGYIWLIGRPHLPRPVPYAFLPKENLPQVTGPETWTIPSDFVFPPLRGEGDPLPVGDDPAHME